MSQGPRCIYWCFTIKQPEDYDIPRDWSYVKYCIWQAEVGEAGNEHLQGYVVFIKQMRLSGLKKVCYEAHWEPRRGTDQQAKEYCKKADNAIDGPWEIGSEDGIPAGPGARTDLDALKRDMDAGMSLSDIAYNHTALYLRYDRGIRNYVALRSDYRRFAPGEKPALFVLTGPSGCGKTRLARECFPGAYWFTKPTGNCQLWFDDYSGQEVIIFDEFYSWIPYDFLLRLLDFGEMLLPFKGGQAKCRAKIFVFSSNCPYTEWYARVANKDGLYRRLSEFGEVYHWSVNDREFKKEIVFYFQSMLLFKYQ
jgi:hypothetical protein